MRVIDIFANVSEQVVQDKQVKKYGAVLLKHGFRGVTKVNPTVIWVDAVIAVIEATNSYLCYCAAREITQQLSEFNSNLETTLGHDIQFGEMEIKLLLKDKKNRLNHIERVGQVNRKEIKISQKKARLQLEHLNKLHVLLQKERLNSGCFHELVGLQVCLDSCIDATLSLLLNPNGEST